MAPPALLPLCQAWASHELVPAAGLEGRQVPTFRFLGFGISSEVLHPWGQADHESPCEALKLSFPDVEAKAQRAAGPWKQLGKVRQAPRL